MVKKIIPTDLLQDYGDFTVEKIADSAKHLEKAQAFLPVLNVASEDFPYIKTLVAALKMPRNISDAILGSKVADFLYTSELSQEKLDKLKKMFSQKDQRRVWERVVLSINAHDDKEKTRITGKLFTALVDEKITKDEFFDMVHATNTLNVYYIDYLKQLYSLGDESIPGSANYVFVTLGLINIDNSRIGTIGGGGPDYPLNQLGWKYAGIVTDNGDTAIPGVMMGVDELVREYDENGQLTGKSLPLKTIQEKGTYYHAVDVFIVNNKGEVLCEHDDVPYLLASSNTSIGFSNEILAERLAKEKGIEITKKPLGVIGRKMEDEKVTRWAYAITVDDEYAKEGLYFQPYSAVLSAIQTKQQFSDKTRYYTSLLEQLVQHAS